MSTLEVMSDIAREAGSKILQEYTKIHTAYLKPDGSLVSEVDKEIEEFVYQKLNKAFPDCRFLGEEVGLRNSKGSGRLFWCDPLDGTHNFLSGIPFFANSLAEIGLTPDVGVTYDPLRNELFAADKSYGSFLNGQPITVSSVDTLGAATIGFTRGSGMESRRELGKIYAIFSEEGRNSRILGAVTLHYAYVACGRFDALVDIGNQPWDIAAGVALIQSAGGKVTDLDGNLYVPEMNRIVASNGTAIHDKILELIKKIS